MGVGITSYGVYIPRYRLERKKIQEAIGWASPYFIPGEKAVANYDEDSVTMAHAASLLCTEGKKEVEVLYFASTTNPLGEGEAASIIMTALGLEPSVRTADFSNSLKAGTSALLSAFDAVKAGAKGALVCAADMRLGKPGSLLEMLFGDGGAAFRIGQEGVVAELKGHFSLSCDFPDYRRLWDDQFVKAAEERFIREEGYGKLIVQAIEGILKKYGLKAKDFAKVGYPCLNLGEYYRIAKQLGFESEQIQEPLLTQIGETGCASPLMILAWMLENAKVGENVLIVSYGNGSEALWFEVKEGIESHRGKVKRMFERSRPLLNYNKYLAFRKLLPIELELLGDIPSSQPPLLWRERKAILGLWGSKCKRCGTPQYPPQRICVNPECNAIDEMEEYWFANRPARLFTFTVDNSAETLNPPMIYGFVDFEEGGRFVFEITDCEVEEVRIGMPLRMSLRRKYEDRQRGFVGYFWKAIPAF